jgi:Flp pilus assembly protein CpaB
MNRRLIMVLVFATIVGLIASFFVYQVVRQMALAGAPEGTDPVVVAAVNMTMAEAVTSQHVRLVQWPKSAIPTGAVRTLANAEGRVVRSAIMAGEPLLESRLAPELAGKGGVMPMLVPEGQRGVSIKVDEAIRESGFILPNSRVDVLVSMTKPGSTSERIAKVILQDVPILAAGQTVEMRDNKPITVTTVTLALTPDQTERLAVAQSEGRITLTTRNLRDNQFVRTPGATQATLLSDVARPTVAAAASAAPVKPRPVSVAAAPLPPPAPEGHTVSVLRGTRLTEQQFIRAGERGWVERQQVERR